MNWLFYIAMTLVLSQGETPIKDTDAFIAEFDKVAENTSSIKTKFIQKKFLSFSKEPLVSEGMLYFQDQKMRWEQESPKDYLMVINDDQLKIREDGKVTEHDLAANKYMRGMKEIMVGSMTGNLLSSDQFETNLFENDEAYIVKMVPKPKRIKKMFIEVKLTIDKNSYRMKNVILTEPEGDYTLITFEDPKFNETLDSKLFILKE